ncbi:MAG TPA: FkbM family methyltransferase, partial [Terracidiphilus sp.]|nr:FkbM family methyltransferase [Terracidiphilus sp.]
PSNEARVQQGGEAAVTGHEVSQVTLETSVERMGGAVDLLQMNCEGAEWEILRPGPWWRAVRNLRMEYHLFGDETTAQARAMVQALGFHVTRCRQTGEKGGMIWALRR